MIAISTLSVVPASFRSPHFGRQKLDGPSQRCGRRGKRGDQADVAELRDAHDEQDVVRLDIPVRESGIVDGLDPGEDRRQNAENFVLRQRTAIQTRSEGIRFVFLTGNGIGGFHRVEEMLLVLLDVE